MNCLRILVSVPLLVLGAASVNPKHPHSPIDGFKMIMSLPHLLGIYTSSYSPVFKCLSADRTRFDPQHKVATYVWYLKGLDGTEKKNSSFDITPGAVPDQGTFFLDNDLSKPYTAFYNYTNYKNCLVMVLPYQGEDLCMLWVDRSVADSIPDDCESQYADTCEVRVPEYDKDLCSQYIK